MRSQNFLPSQALPVARIFILGQRLQGAGKYADTRFAITKVFNRNHRCYGYRRIQAAALDKHKFCLSEKVVQRLMMQKGLVVAVMKRPRYGFHLEEIRTVLKNLIKHDFQAVTLDEKWLTDITKFQISAGKVYLLPVSFLPFDSFDSLF